MSTHPREWLPAALAAIDPDDREWLLRAACRGRAPEEFFASARAGANLDLIRTCTRCPVQVACLALALRVPADYDRHGIYGGTLPRQRRQMRERMAAREVNAA